MGGGVGAVLHVGGAERGGLLQEIHRAAAAPLRVGASRHRPGEGMKEGGREGWTLFLDHAFHYPFVRRFVPSFRSFFSWFFVARSLLLRTFIRLVSFVRSMLMLSVRSSVRSFVRSSVLLNQCFRPLPFGCCCFFSSCFACSSCRRVDFEKLLAKDGTLYVLGTPKKCAFLEEAAKASSKDGVKVKKMSYHLQYRVECFPYRTGCITPIWYRFAAYDGVCMSHPPGPIFHA